MHPYWISGIFQSTMLCGGHRKMSQMRHILRGLGTIIFLLEKGKKVRSGFLGEQIPAGYTLHRHAVWGGAALWDLESLELLTWGTALQTPPCALLYTIISGQVVCFFQSFLFISILKHLHFFRERGEEAAASFCGGNQLRVLFFLYLILGEH